MAAVHQDITEPSSAGSVRRMRRRVANRSSFSRLVCFYWVSILAVVLLLALLPVLAACRYVRIQRVGHNVMSTPGPPPEPLAPDSDIYVMNASGSVLTQVTSGPEYDEDPVWSPDGKKIAFVRATLPSSGPGFESSHIYVINVDGTGLRGLTSAPDEDASPSWSPDGTKIAFHREVVLGYPDNPYVGPTAICVMKADGTGLTALSDGQAYDTSPTWSPDGTRIAFFSLWEVCVMNADGTAKTILTRGGSVEPFSHLAWSPDGGKIAFVSMRSLGSSKTDIWTVRADGTEQRRLTKSPSRDVRPVWSPDGARIAFVREIYSRSRGGGDELKKSDIYLVNPDGSALTKLSDGSDPAWSPDGQSIAFAREGERQYEGPGWTWTIKAHDIWVAGVEGGKSNGVTTSTEWDNAPAWSPDGTKIAFARGTFAALVR